jgi:Ca2+:H+ antiporter
MADPDQDWNKIPTWCWAAPLAAGVLVVAKFAQVISPDNGLVIALAVVFLGGAVFAAVHHAEVLAVRIGEPFGSILLALAITTLEVGLIISVMASGAAGSDTVARDTVFSVTMIVLNGIVGVCLVAGAWRHYEQEFKLQGAAGYPQRDCHLGHHLACPAEFHADNARAYLCLEPASLCWSRLAHSLSHLRLRADRPPP